MSDEGLDSKDRRRLIIATGGALGLSTLAGCSAEEEGGGDGDGEGSGPTRPSPGGIDTAELDPVLTFLVRSHDYQNALLEREFGDG